MAWQKQAKKKSDKVEAYKKDDDSYSTNFLKDWQDCRDRHPGQKEVLKAVFEEKMKYVFYRAGRKGAKTTTGIDVAWRLANEAPNRVGYLCYRPQRSGREPNRWAARSAGAHPRL